jgi:hypothetical protein
MEIGNRNSIRCETRRAVRYKEKQNLGDKSNEFETQFYEIHVFKIQKLITKCILMTM